MRTLSKYLLLLSATGLIIPSLAMAESAHSPRVEPSPFAGSTPSVSPSPSSTPDTVPPGKPAPLQFCARFSDATGKLGSDTVSNFNQLSSNFSQRSGKISADFKTITDKLSLERTTADTQRMQKFSELQAQAITPSEKSAVTTFEAAINLAVSTRRAATDAADAAFKAGLLTAAIDRQSQLKSAALAYESAVSADLAAAKASCVAGTSPDTVRMNLKTSLASALANLNAVRKSATGVGPNLDTLKATRKASIDKANADFQSQVAAALAALKSALGVKPTPAPTPTH